MGKYNFKYYCNCWARARGRAEAEKRRRAGDEAETRQRDEAEAKQSRGGEKPAEFRAINVNENASRNFWER